MVSEWEKEELGKLTLRNLKAVPKQEPVGKMTHQNLRTLKGVSQQSNTGKAKFTAFFDRLWRGIIGGFLGIFTPKLNRKGVDPCEQYGHNWVSGTSWEGLYPKCLDCGEPITDASQLRGALTKTERSKFRTGQRQSW